MSNSNASPDEGVPVSVKIRERLKANRMRFHSNDNIAAAIEPGDLDAMLEEVTEKMRGVLESMVIDTENDHNTADTARRVAKMYIRRSRVKTCFYNIVNYYLFAQRVLTTLVACGNQFNGIIALRCIGIVRRFRG